MYSIEHLATVVLPELIRAISINMPAGNITLVHLYVMSLKACTKVNCLPIMKKTYSY